MDDVYLDLFFISWTDVLGSVLALLIASILLIPIVRKSGALSPREAFRMRLSVVVPMAATAAMMPFEYGFGSVRLIYHIGMIAYPIVGVTLVWIAQKRAYQTRYKALTLAVGIAAILLVPLVGWMTFVEPTWLDVTETEVRTDAPGSATPIRIVVLADVQTDGFGEWEKRVADETNRLRPDIVLIPGDLLQARGADYLTEKSKAVDFLRSFKVETRCVRCSRRCRPEGIGLRRRGHSSNEPSCRI